MADFFYFMSSLPMLRWGEKPSISYGKFIDQCRSLLADGLASEIAELKLLPGDSTQGMSPVALAWHDFEVFLRNTVGAIRRNRMRKANAVLSIHGTGYLSSMDIRKLEEIMALQSPLERENALDLFRWRFLDGISGDFAYSRGAVEIYALRLLLLEKQTSRQYEAGKAAFDSMMEAGFQKALGARTTEEVL